ncbi:MAG: ribonuclease Z [Desulfobacterales bacterium]|jgi:ribonuclease Z|nr:ribonuclease Z [Desulfobacterales bacterium]
MRPSYHPRLVNGPFEDPGVFVSLFLYKRAFLFDLGDLHALSPKDILKVTHAFVSHTHMDHFIGFDHLLRLFLGREKDLHLFGPRGFIHNIEGKLAGYTWNLVDQYHYRFTLHVSEVHADHILTRRFHCPDQFRPDGPPEKKVFSGVLLSEPPLTVSTVVLDHKIDSLGFRLSERFHINILKSALNRLNLPVGPWIRRLKETLYEGAPRDSIIEIPCGENLSETRNFEIGTLADQVALITPGQSIGYISDAAGHQSNMEKMIQLVHGVDHLFIEAPFLDSDRHLAENTHHLTARQAGHIAREAGVRRCTLFHFSPRYTEVPHLLEQEAAQAAGPTVIIDSPAASRQGGTCT